MPSIILEKERDGAMCKTLFLRRGGTCQGGSCVPFPTDGNPPTTGSVTEKAADLANSLTGTLGTLNPISAAAKAAGGVSGAIGAAINLMPSSLTGDLAKDVTGTSSALETAPVAGKATETVSKAIRTASSLVPSPLRSLLAASTGKK
ncbi:uncharacterized protein LOC121835937 [Ixodes scapularis]|uniref:uncharacterized protein LOC121835937 n=1 Tax=Ixodes scapularis TaxID=6945 RepID=UPI001C38F1F1|nr:uncharacterized protein LOC121835937 [Ixodes scapularis]